MQRDKRWPWHTEVVVQKRQKRTITHCQWKTQWQKKKKRENVWWSASININSNTMKSKKKTRNTHISLYAEVPNSLQIQIIKTKCHFSIHQIHSLQTKQKYTLSLFLSLSLLTHKQIICLSNPHFHNSSLCLSVFPSPSPLLISVISYIFFIDICSATQQNFHNLSKSPPSCNV